MGNNRRKKSRMPIKVNYVQNSGNNIPDKFKLPEKKNPKLSTYAAHFIANAMVYHDFFLARIDDINFEYNSTVLLHMLTSDSLDNFHKGDYDKPIARARLDEDGLPNPSYEGVKGSEFWVVAMLRETVQDRFIYILDCFEGQPFLYSKKFAFPSELGRKRLRDEHPEVFKKLIGEDT